MTSALHDPRTTKPASSCDDVGAAMHALMSELYPICRSITGPGVRETLAILQRYLPLELHHVPTGESAFDWQVPREWRIRDAYVKDASGRRVIDFLQSNLHVVNYSVPVRARLTWSELKTHLFTAPEHPEWIPYRTSYYQENWGFCLSQRQWDELDRRSGDDEEFDVCIDSELIDGVLSYGEAYLPGESDEEVLFSCHVCHPSLANDNLSGIAVATFLARHLAELPRRYSYRFLFIPATIGALVWLSRNEDRVQRIRHGLVLSLLGDPGCSTYKKSRRGNAQIDRAALHVLKHAGQDYRTLEFEPYGYDERQFCSPGFNLPIGCLMRTSFGQYPEYHTSADNLEFIKAESLADSWRKCAAIVEILEHDRTFLNQNPKGEPQLGRRGLYRAMGGELDRAGTEKALLWVLNLSDGEHSLFDIAERAGLAFAVVRRAAELLQEHQLISECQANGPGAADNSGGKEPGNAKRGTVTRPEC
jgi:aminopeptidase-like protein